MQTATSTSSGSYQDAAADVNATVPANTACQLPANGSLDIYLSKYSTGCKDPCTCAPLMVLSYEKDGFTISERLECGCPAVFTMPDPAVTQVHIGLDMNCTPAASCSSGLCTYTLNNITDPKTPVQISTGPLGKVNLPSNDSYQVYQLVLNGSVCGIPGGCPVVLRY